MDKPCEYANWIDDDVWECTAHGVVGCLNIEFDFNPDGSVNIVKCGRYKEKIT